MKRKSTIHQFVLMPLLAGLFGYAIFFTILLICKWLGCIIDTTQTFSVDTVDLLIGMVGFVLLFMVRVLENFSKTH